MNKALIICLTIFLATLLSCNGSNPATDTNNTTSASLTGYWQEIGCYDADWDSSSGQMVSESLWYENADVHDYSTSPIGSIDILKIDADSMYQYGYYKADCYDKYAEAYQIHGDRILYEDFALIDDDILTYWFAGDYLVINFKEIDFNTGQAVTIERMYYKPYTGSFPPQGWPPEVCLYE